MPMLSWVLLIWSHWLPHRVWRGVFPPAKLDKACRWLSNAVGRFVSAEGGCVISHTSIQYSQPYFFWPDGVHLSAKGSDVFLADLQGALHDCLVGNGREGC